MPKTLNYRDPSGVVPPVWAGQQAMADYQRQKSGERHFHGRSCQFGGPRRSRMVAANCEGCGRWFEYRLWPSVKPKRFCSGRCYRISVGGARNPNWKGGVGPAHKAIRRSEAYRHWRRAVFERDKYTCVWCGQRGGKLNADHIKAFSTHPEFRLDVANGRTLCVECHSKTPTFLAGALKGRRKCAGQMPIGGGVPRRTHCPCGRPYDFREKNGSPRCKPCRAALAKRGEGRRRQARGLQLPLALAGG